MSLFRARRFDRACDAFEALARRYPDDGVRRALPPPRYPPPPVDWDGVYQLASK